MYHRTADKNILITKLKTRAKVFQLPTYEVQQMHPDLNLNLDEDKDEEAGYFNFELGV